MLLLVIQTGGMAAVAVTFARYFLELTDWSISDSLVAVSALALLTAINCVGVRAGSHLVTAFRQIAPRIRRRCMPSGGDEPQCGRRDGQLSPATTAEVATRGQLWPRRNELETQLHASLAEPLEQRRHMHLVGLVVAGQGVHHEVHARPIGEFALARGAGLSPAWASLHYRLAYIPFGTFTPAPFSIS